MGVSEPSLSEHSHSETLRSSSELRAFSRHRQTLGPSCKGMGRRKGSAGHEESYTPEGCVRAINKKAQKRFRDKKKAERESVEKNVAELSLRLNELEASHKHLTQRNHSLEQHAQRSGEETPAELSSTDESCPDTTWVAEIINFARGPNGPAASHEECEALLNDTNRRFFNLKEDYVKRLSQMMEFYRHEPSQRLNVQIMDYVLMMRKHRARLRRRMFRPGRNKHGPAHHGAFQHPKFAERMPDVMPALVSSLFLSFEQVSSLRAAQQEYCQKSAKLRLERGFVMQQLKKMEDPGDDNGQIVPMFSSSRRLQLTTVLHEQLQANVAADGKCLLQFATRIVEILTPWQEACLLGEGFRKHGIMVEILDVPDLLEGHMLQHLELLHPFVWCQRTEVFPFPGLDASTRELLQAAKQSIK